MDAIPIRSVERLAGFVGEIEWIDRVFRQVRSKAQTGNDRPLEIVIAVNAHRVGVHRPVVGDASKGGDLPFHQPGAQLGRYPLGPDTVSRVRGKLTFSDGQVVWHSPLFAWRVRQVAEAVRAGGGGASA